MAEVKDEVLAEAMGMDRSQISRIRSGERGIRIQELDKLYKVLGLATVCDVGDVVTMTAERAHAIEYLAAEALMRRVK